MTAEPNDQEFEAVLKLPPQERFRHFLTRIVDFDHVWMAEDEKGLVTVNAEDGREVLPVWPARRYAESAMKKSWPDASYVAMTVHDWLEKTLLPLEDADDVALAVFPDSEGFGEYVLIPDMIADVKAELATRLEALPGYDPTSEEIDLDELLRTAMKASMKAKPKSKLP